MIQYNFFSLFIGENIKIKEPFEITHIEYDLINN